MTNARTHGCTYRWTDQLTILIILLQARIFVSENLELSPWKKYKTFFFRFLMQKY